MCLFCIMCRIVQLAVRLLPAPETHNSAVKQVRRVPLDAHVKKKKKESSMKYEPYMRASDCRMRSDYMSEMLMI